MQGKTQVYGLGASDYYRSRLTHSLEVAQIGKGIALRLAADPDLVEAVCLAHDIGHPPFGHAGEAALHEALYDFGGFNGNAQNIRILTNSELKSTEYRGLNLTSATLDGLIKYPWPLDPKAPEGDPSAKKGYYRTDSDVVEKFNIRDRKTFECQIMNWADDVAYSAHDLEDALAIGTISRELGSDPDQCTQIFTTARQSYQKDYPREELHDQLTMSEAEGYIDAVVKQCIDRPRTSGAPRLATLKMFFAEHINSCVVGVTARNTGDKPYRYSRDLLVPPHIIKRVEVYKAITMVCVIQTEPVITLQHAGKRIIADLFNALTNSDNRELQFLYASDWREAVVSCLNEIKSQIDVPGRSLRELARDYIASMTDLHAESLWRRMFSPSGGSLFTAKI